MVYECSLASETRKSALAVTETMKCLTKVKVKHEVSPSTDYRKYFSLFSVTRPVLRYSVN